jgi:hypothetical protein
MEAGPDGVVQDTRSDSDLQMVRNPASCLVIKLIETVVANDIQGFRANYRWAGFEAGDDFSRLQHMLLISTMPFTLRMDPPIYEFSGRGEPDLARIKARLACNEVQESYPDGFAVREVRAIRLDSIEDKCTVELFYDGKKYQVSRFVWAAGGPQ